MHRRRTPSAATRVGGGTKLNRPDGIYIYAYMLLLIYMLLLMTASMPGTRVGGGTKLHQPDGTAGGYPQLNLHGVYMYTYIDIDRYIDT